jgi:hypothetical protein
MNQNDPKLEIEITIATKYQKPGRRGKQTEPQVSDQPRIPLISRLMALTIKFQDMVDRGEVRDYADLARLGYVSRARITQIMNLLNLAPQLQDNMMLDPKQAAAISASESQLRKITSLVLWQDQLDAWEQISGVPRTTVNSVSGRGGMHGPNAPSGELRRKFFVQKGTTKGL